MAKSQNDQGLVGPQLRRDGVKTTIPTIGTITTIEDVNRRPASSLTEAQHHLFRFTSDQNKQFWLVPSWFFLHFFVILSKIKLSNEDELILLCTRLNINSTVQQKIRELLNSSINWTKIIAISSYHQILILFYYSLNRLNLQGLISPEIYPALNNCHYINLKRNIRSYW